MDSKLQIVFTTNIDDMKRETWPNVCCRPVVGDMVESNSGKVLEVVSCTHREASGSLNKKPYLEVELHKPRHLRGL